MKFRIVIIDDEPLAIELLKHYLKEESDFVVTATFTKPKEAVLFLNSNTIDLLLLDINMPGLTGLELLSQLKKTPQLIFTTAYNDFLQTGFDVGIVDYLQKPIKKDRLTVAVGRARERLASLSGGDKTLNIISLRSGEKEVFVNPKDILFAKAVKDYCYIYLTNNQKIISNISLKTLLELLKTGGAFLRVHKSFIVGLEKIEMIKNNRTVIMQEYEIPIGRKYKADFYKSFLPE
jgi:DNA-binding LytR/AlgR family response regulator